MYLREATKDDVDLIFNWANDDDERRFSFNPQKIVYEDHCRWYEKKLNSDDTSIYVLMCDDTPVGQCRLDVEEQDALISYFIDKSYRNRGYGKRLLNLVADKVVDDYPMVSCLVAQVKTENILSQKVFLSLGYTEEIFPEYKEYKNML